jgi:hypothetical protein
MGPSIISFMAIISETTSRGAAKYPHRADGLSTFDIVPR